MSTDHVKGVFYLFDLLNKNVSKLDGGNGLRNISRLTSDDDNFNKLIKCFIVFWDC